MIFHVAWDVLQDAKAAVSLLVLGDVEEVVLAIAVENVMAPVVALAALVALVAVLVETSSLSIDEKKWSALERRNGEEYNIHRH